MIKTQKTLKSTALAASYGQRKGTEFMSPSSAGKRRVRGCDDQDEDGEETARIVLGAAAWRRLEKLIADRRRAGQETKP
jgi:hypothetical protein